MTEKKRGKTWLSKTGHVALTLLTSTAGTHLIKGDTHRQTPLGLTIFSWLVSLSQEQEVPYIFPSIHWQFSNQLSPWKGGPDDRTLEQNTNRLQMTSHQKWEQHDRNGLVTGGEASQIREIPYPVTQNFYLVNSWLRHSKKTSILWTLGYFIAR